MHADIAPEQTQSPIGDAMFESVFDHSLGFRITMDHEAACQFLRRIDRYNDFQAESVIDALERIDRLIPRSQYGDGNPNTGKRRYSLSVGREGSPVLYLEFYEWNSNEQLSDETLQIICREMELTGRADEADYEAHPTGFGGRKVTFRFWWD